MDALLRDRRLSGSSAAMLSTDTFLADVAIAAPSTVSSCEKTGENRRDESPTLGEEGDSGDESFRSYVVLPDDDNDISPTVVAGAAVRVTNPVDVVVVLWPTLRVGLAERGLMESGDVEVSLIPSPSSMEKETGVEAMSASP